LTKQKLEPWVGIDSVTEYLDISKVTLCRWVKAKKIPHHQVGKCFKFKISEIDYWVLKWKKCK